MDDLTPFDRQIAAEFSRDAGPPEPVDDAAIFTAITDAQSPKWRFQTMFSATRYILASAVVALFSVALLAGLQARPTDESGVPGAPTVEVSDATGVTGSYGLSFDVTPGEVTYEDGIRRRSDEISRGIQVEASDPRFSGEMTFTMSDVIVNARSGAFWGEQAIENDAGSWTGSVLGAGAPPSEALAMGRYVGSGAYEGLSAVVFFDTQARTFEGIILTGDLPPIE